METIVRIQPRQGTFSANQKLVDVEIPANSGVVDLSSSYVAVRVAAVIDDNSAATTEAGVFNVGTNFGFRDGSGADSATKEFLRAPTSAVLVKNASLMSSMKGKIADVRNVACLAFTKALLEKDETELDDEKGMDGSSKKDSKISGGNLLEANQGSEKSSQRSNEIQIPLKEIFNFCREDSYDTSKMGALRIHLECHFDRLQASTSITAANYDANVNGQAALGDYKTMTNLAGVANATVVQTAATYDALEDAPWYNQQKVTLAHSTAGGAQADQIKQIVKVEHDQATKKVNITLDTEIQAGALTTTALTLVPVIPNGVTPSIENVDAVVTYKPVGDTDDEIQYTEYQTLEDNFTPAKAFQRNYHLAPNCVNAYVLFPSPIASVVDQTKGDDNISSYRIAIDNEQLSNRRIEMGSATHLDLLQKVYTNMGVPLKNTLASIRARNFLISDDQNSRHPVSVIAFPVPNAMDGKSKMLTIDLEAKDTVPTSASGNFQLSGNITIYQEVVRQI
tara:strand:+ start:3277 stop:4800 length:1524 start_codon:yes stop_codon:yes gene_type:complete